MQEVAISSGSGLNYVSWSQAAEVARYFAATTIPAGTLLTQNMVSAKSSVAAGEDVVGLSLKAGQLPGNLQPGDTCGGLRDRRGLRRYRGHRAHPAGPGHQRQRERHDDRFHRRRSRSPSSRPTPAPLTCSASNGNVGLALLPGNG